MKHLAMAYFLLGTTLFFFSWKAQEADSISGVKETLMELQQENAGPQVIITENHWSHSLHHLWRADTPSLVLPVRDVKNSYLRKKKKFQCQHPVYWLGEQKPPKLLNALGSWKPMTSTAAKENALQLFRVE